MLSLKSFVVNRFVALKTNISIHDYGETLSFYGNQSDELNCQKKLRTEVIQLEDQLAQVRREYEMLRIEFEQTLAANEQTSK